MGFGYQHRLQVTIEAGVNLVAADRNGRSDPYCKLIVNGALTRKTKTIKKNLNPVWHETFKFYAIYTTGKLRLDFEVYDWDFILKDDFLGKASIEIDSNDIELDKEYTQVLTLQNTTGGSIKVSYLIMEGLDPSVKHTITRAASSGTLPVLTPSPKSVKPKVFEEKDMVVNPIIPVVEEKTTTEEETLPSPTPLTVTTFVEPIEEETTLPEKTVDIVNKEIDEGKAAKENVIDDGMIYWSDLNDYFVPYLPAEFALLSTHASNTELLAAFSSLVDNDILYVSYKDIRGYDFQDAHNAYMETYLSGSAAAAEQAGDEMEILGTEKDITSVCTEKYAQLYETRCQTSNKGTGKIVQQICISGLAKCEVMVGFELLTSQIESIDDKYLILMRIIQNTRVSNTWE